MPGRKRRLTAVESKYSRIGLLALILLTVPLLVYWGLNRSVPIPCSGDPIPREILGEIMPGNEILQEFRCLAENLSRIDVFMATYARRNVGELIFRIEQRGAKDNSGNEEYRELRMPLTQIADNMFQPFRFQPFPRSEGKIFHITLSAPQATSGNAVTAYQSELMDQGSLLKAGGKNMDGSLCFRIVQHRPVLEVGRTALVLIMEGKPLLLKSTATHVALSLSLIVTTFLIIYLVIKYPTLHE